MSTEAPVLLRSHWESSFQRAGIPSSQMFAMSDYDFVKACDVLIAAGFEIPALPDPSIASTQSTLFSTLRSLPKPSSPPPERHPSTGLPSFLVRSPNCSPSLSVLDPAAVIRSSSWEDSLPRGHIGSPESPASTQMDCSIDEDPEFERTFEAALMELPADSNDQPIEDEDDSVNLTVVLPGGRSIQKKFQGTELGGEIFMWVGEQLQKGIEKFEILVGKGQIEKGKSLRKQGIVGERILSVFEIDS
jgi:hypothetical protein